MSDVTCAACGQTWPRDPALEVVCPTCHAAIGVRCRRPSGHGCNLHAERDRKALAELDWYGTCPAGPSACRQDAEQFELFAEVTG